MVEGLPDWATFGVPTVVLIVALINIMKDTYGLESKYAFPVATALAAVEGTAIYFGTIYPVVATVNSIVIGAILIGLAANGYYSGVKAHLVRDGE